jgi:hypothetical protein
MGAAWRDLATRRADLLLCGGRLIDPANNRGGIADVAMRNGSSGMRYFSAVPRHSETPVCRTFLRAAVGPDCLEY